MSSSVDVLVKDEFRVVIVSTVGVDRRVEISLHSAVQPCIQTTHRVITTASSQRLSSPFWTAGRLWWTRPCVLWLFSSKSVDEERTSSGTAW